MFKIRDFAENCETCEMILGVDQRFGTPQVKPVSSSGLNYPAGGQNNGYFWIDLPQEDVKVTSKLKYRASTLTTNRIGKHVVTANVIFMKSNFTASLSRCYSCSIAGAVADGLMYLILSFSKLATHQLSWTSFL
ncbi:hypothetical protein F2Q70_00021894 [Brassica cretica]|uniref:Uncharacterized protein n=2 Tax=Brassica cretica TaxID=69181 RepID=A0A8S9GX08_BRACR|nr:hypothetical protein F2Q70_00021894 [Brassica cretica]KAF2559005.1 hypothetical protein F2Q68_00015653 [Brassica cretica]KAF3607977.1 hypothetical protein DY000_02048252 [Brassica cretica]